MASVRERVLEAIKDMLVTALPGADVVRDSQEIGEAGLAGRINIISGEPGEPEVTLSPVTYTYQHRIGLEILPPPAGLDAVLVPIGQAIEADRFLGGLVEWLEPTAPDVASRDVDGSAQIDWAEVGLLAIYSTTNPLL